MRVLKFKINTKRTEVRPYIKNFPKNLLTLKYFSEKVYGECTVLLKRVNVLRSNNK